MPRWLEQAEGMETPTRARRRKLETAKADLEPPSTPEGRVSSASWNPKGLRRSTGPQSTGAAPTMNRSAKGGARSSLHYGDEGVLIHPPHQGVCGRHGTEERRVTSGGLTASPEWHRRKRTYKRTRSGERRAVSRRTAE